MIMRTLAALALIGLLWALDVIDLSSLPWDSQEFRAGGATVLVYLAWSAWESRYRRGSVGSAYAVFYAVLLVTALDSFLLELTTWSEPSALRWAGLFVFAAGCGFRIQAYRSSSSGMLRTGRLLQLAGLPVALGSIAGLALAVLAGIPGSIHEELDPPETVEEESGAL